jgi:hypothetical protein
VCEVCDMSVDMGQQVVCGHEHLNGSVREFIHI